MQRTISEQKVLKRLGIQDFRHMTKDKIMKFATMLSIPHQIEHYTGPVLKRPSDPFARFAL